MQFIRRCAAGALALVLMCGLAACSCSGGVSSSSSSSSSSSTTTSSSSSSSATSSSSESSVSPDVPSDSNLPDDPDAPFDPVDPDDPDVPDDPLIPDDEPLEPDDSVGQAAAPPTYASVELTETGLDEDALLELDNEKHGWGPGKETDADGIPLECVRCNGLYGKYDAVFAGEPSERRVTLTFDLGYENGYTEKILDTLREKGVQAVFFLTGDYLRAEPEIVRRLIDEGHTLGNHTVKHKCQPDLTIADAAAEITALHDEVAANYRYEMTLFRPPEGTFSERTLALAQALGYRTVFWSYAYVDWKVDAQPDPAEAMEKLTGALHPGAIYLLHAVSSTNAEILGDFIDAARAAGYAL